MHEPLYPRFLRQQIDTELRDPRIMLLCGPRQSGKTTLAQRISRNAMSFFPSTTPLRGRPHPTIRWDSFAISIAL